jgi:CheY-like chemotaxis protein
LIGNSDASRSRQRRALVADDERLVLDFVTTVLTSEGFSVTKATNGLDALAAFRAGPPFDVALLNVAMPGCSGIEALALIRAVSTLPVLVFSGDGRNKGPALAAGATAFVETPFPSVGELLRLVRSVIDGQPTK